MQAGNRLTFVKSQPLSLAGHADYDEAWLEQLIKSDTALLGLGSIDVVTSQIHHAKGRLDLLCRDEKNEVIYVVELMLGALDESHIVRTVEYWLRERDRKSHEDYELVAVLAAERVLESRFVDVVRFLSRQMPLLLMEISALQVENRLTLKFTRVFDRANNFMTFQPKRQFLKVWARTARAVAFAKNLKDVGIEVLSSSDAEWVGFRVTPPQFKQHRSLLKQLAQACYEERQGV